MLKRTLVAMLALTCCGLSGCMNDTIQRMDGLTPAAGDAIAANTVMQMVDPWQYGVQDTDLEVPADRGDTPGSDDGYSSDSPSSDNGSATNGQGG